MALIAMTAALCMGTVGVQAHDESKYPNFEGQWKRPPGITNQYEGGRQRENTSAPLTAEYRAIFEANLKDQAEGGQGTDPTITCIPDGMPRAMNVVLPMEVIVRPKMTHMIIENLSMLRRIFTDGRDWPEDAEPAFMGTSIGKWIDEDGDGRYDVLEIETRNMKGPRSFDSSGLPLHDDNKTIVKERIYLSKDNPDVLVDEITTYDSALTRPWTVRKTYHRVHNPIWYETICAEGNQHVKIGNELYMLSADGDLMPAKKNQRPPDLKHFK